MHICNNITLLTHKEDQTPLHIASRLGKTEIVQLLLQHMAHPDAATINGYTPLHIAAREGHLDVTSVLLEAGASHSLATKVSDSQIWLPCWKNLFRTLSLLSSVYIHLARSAKGLYTRKHVNILFSFWRTGQLKKILHPCSNLPSWA